MRDENDFLKCEMMSAQQQITELEKHLFEIREGSVEQIEKLNEKLKYLREREEQKQQENHELREQNELLEFRIIELEESHDKVRDFFFNLLTVILIFTKFFFFICDACYYFCGAIYI